MFRELVLASSLVFVGLFAIAIIVIWRARPKVTQGAVQTHRPTIAAVWAW